MSNSFGSSGSRNAGERKMMTGVDDQCARFQDILTRLARVVDAVIIRPSSAYHRDDSFGSECCAGGMGRKKARRRNEGLPGKNGP